MPTYKELCVEQQKLDKKMALARVEEAAAALARVTALVAQYGFTAQQVFPWKPEAVKPGKKKAEIKFRNPATGAGWSGLGRVPNWLAGKDRSAYAVLP